MIGKVGYLIGCLLLVNPGALGVQNKARVIVDKELGVRVQV